MQRTKFNSRLSHGRKTSSASLFYHRPQKGQNFPQLAPPHGRRTSSASFLSSPFLSPASAGIFNCWLLRMGGEFRPFFFFTTDFEKVKFQLLTFHIIEKFSRFFFSTADFSCPNKVPSAYISQSVCKTNYIFSTYKFFLMIFISRNIFT